MNQTSETDLSFEDGQIVWNYIFLCILFLVILLNNSLVLTALCSQKRLQSQLNAIILASLALAQLIGGLMSILINIALVQNYDEDSRLKIAIIVTTFSGVATQLHLSVLCGERYAVVVESVAYGNIKRGIVIITVITWSLSILAALLSLVDFNNYSVFLVIVFFVLPILFDMSGYVLLYRHSKGHNQTTLLKKQLRLAKWFAIFTIIFNILWLPFMVTILLHENCGSCDTEQSSLYLFILYFQLFSLTISAVIYYRASLDFRLAFKMVASELCNVIGRNTNSDHPPDVAMRDGTMPRDANENHVNIGMVWNAEGNRDALPNELSPRYSRDDNFASKARREEVHIVPFDQTKYFDTKSDTQEDLEEDEVNGRMSLANDEFGFSDIDIVPYDQSC